MKRASKVALALAFGLGLSAVSHAASSDTLTVTITPNAFYSVDIDTANVSLNLGTVALGASTQTVQPATVTVLSTYLTTDLKLQGAITAASDPWSFDDVTTSSEADKVATWATFTSVQRSSAPAQTGDYFSGTQPAQNNSDVVSANAEFVGTANGVNNLFENSSGPDNKDMDDMNPFPAASSQSHLWLFFRLPATTTSSNAQNISITIGAAAPQS